MSGLNEYPEEVGLLAEGLLNIARSMRILRLMEDSGHPNWEGYSAEQVLALAADDAEQIGLDLTHPKAEEMLAELLAWRQRELQAMPYAQYLQTPEWKDVRRFAIKRAGGRCQTCNASRGLQVHHRTYDRRGRELLDDVTVLCGMCHKAFHGARSLTR